MDQNNSKFVITVFVLVLMIILAFCFTRRVRYGQRTIESMPKGYYAIIDENREFGGYVKLVKRNGKTFIYLSKDMKYWALIQKIDSWVLKRLDPQPKKEVTYGK